jgi:hypothetical protein
VHACERIGIHAKMLILFYFLLICGLLASMLQKKLVSCGKKLNVSCYPNACNVKLKFT